MRDNRYTSLLISPSQLRIAAFGQFPTRVIRAILELTRFGRDNESTPRAGSGGFRCIFGRIPTGEFAGLVLGLNNEGQD